MCTSISVTNPVLYRSVIRLMLGLMPGRIIANSKAVANALIGGSGRRLAKTRIVENSVNSGIEPVDRRDRDRDRPVVVGVVGRLSPRKGIAEAIAAARILADQDLRFEMRFAGDAPPGQPDGLRAYVELAEDAGIGDLVTFAGQVDDVNHFLGECDILLLPSQRPEPFGLVVIEAMASGLPVVATLNSGGKRPIFFGTTRPASILAGIRRRWREHCVA